MLFVLRARSGGEVTDPELWVELMDCWVKELLACERDEFIDLHRTWQRTRRALQVMILM